MPFSFNSLCEHDLINGKINDWTCCEPFEYQTSWLFRSPLYFSTKLYMVYLTPPPPACLCVKYSGYLKTGRVRFSNGPKWIGSKMVWFSIAIQNPNNNVPFFNGRPIQNPDKNVQFSNAIQNQDKKRPFFEWRLKTENPDFECFRYLNVRFSDPHCICYSYFSH